MRTLALFALVAALILGTGVLQSWNSALIILNMGLVSAIMALGVNLQWGLAGLFNVGVMGFVALGGLAVVLTSTAPVPQAWTAGGARIIAALILGAASITLGAVAWRTLHRGRRGLAVAVIAVLGFVAFRWVLDPAVEAVEAVNPAATGYLGGLGLPVLLAWPVGGLLAAGVAWVIGKTALGLRSDYLAIATLGIAEIVIAVLKNEDWLARGVKNVIGLPRPLPYEIDLQGSPVFAGRADALGLDVTTASTLYVKLGYSVLFSAVLIAVLVLAQLALTSPWGRMMRAIRDNEEAAEAMGKDVTARHLQVFILGSVLCGIAGAMMTTLDGQLTPSSYQPLRYTFLIWVMVILGGSGNNLGAVLGGFLVWFLWVQVEPIGQWVMQIATSGMAAESALRVHLLESVQHMRLLTMGIILLVVLRFAPRGLLPEK
ncbi:branched-chain amino acid ABC transporter permease [Salipiger aestuarii]|uniref:Branched-chain amino acid transport system permease protein n=1 Tax=Salipiger aestuarii TaxID=568098 RepID=A0A327XQD0_9RHOB|nr:branched-chain amino acid ABC transporter permease [Salipiger aestuarii]EIE51627.1 branched-chain amino acid ABC transporter, permease protein [Citreicella sp. 357]KAA8606009.1 branched-chain amino acid ABC transporter permease [Salipiger aestuarii]KAA8607434.1 branched-chain amino acid ABC transporter permease [Salipiger aestuarii]KAB2536929.1 branched-chain amino acid ABC transporter permease [Salipiger aestuarii]RAK10411.1 branched-chain amino acid transport system permease protein [Sali